VVVLARLAVCRSIQGQGIARALLADAFGRVLMASEQIGVRGLVVHAASAAARVFYLHMGFDPSPSDPNMPPNAMAVDAISSRRKNGEVAVVIQFLH
jgi:GNAT superfamily N-acetyltransferase